MLLVGNMPEVSTHHNKHYVNRKGLNKDFSITWRQATEIIRKGTTCSLYNQTSPPSGSGKWMCFI